MPPTSRFCHFIRCVRACYTRFSRNARDKTRTEAYDRSILIAQTMLALINFTVTQVDLAEQLLTMVVMHEQPDLETEKDRLVVHTVGYPGA